MTDKPKYFTAPYKEPDHSKGHHMAFFYCSDWRVFKKKIYGTKSCPVCGDNDFDMKSYGASVSSPGEGVGSFE